jgi:hypothetical protein
MDFENKKEKSTSTKLHAYRDCVLHLHKRPVGKAQ